MIRLSVATAAILAISSGVSLVAGPASAGERDRYSESYSIMAPEPWLAPKYKSPRGLPQRPRNKAHPRTEASPTVGVAPPPPPVMVPNGPVVQSLPPVNRGIVPGGARETFSDRAIRCTHQGALYGVPGSQQGSYMSGCLGQ